MASPVPPYALVARHALWRDAQGRLYAPAADVDADADEGASASAEPSSLAGEVSEVYVLIPRAETRKRGAPGAHGAPLDFPLVNDVLEISPLQGAPAPVASTVRIESVARARRNGAVSFVEWRATSAGGAESGPAPAPVSVLGSAPAESRASRFISWLKN